MLQLEGAHLSPVNTTQPLHSGSPTVCRRINFMKISHKAIPIPRDENTLPQRCLIWVIKRRIEGSFT